jgi:hypothetical protein
MRHKTCKNLIDHTDPQKSLKDAITIYTSAASDVATKSLVINTAIDTYNSITSTNINKIDESAESAPTEEMLYDKLKELYTAYMAEYTTSISIYNTLVSNNTPVETSNQ